MIWKIIPQFWTLVFLKVIENNVASRLLTHLEVNNLVNPNQSADRKYHIT